MQQQMKCFHLLNNLQFSSPISSSFLLLHPQCKLPLYPPTSLSRNPNLTSTAIHCRRRWDSETDTFRSRRYTSKPRKDEDDFEQFQRWTQSAAQLLDDIWILKVFKSYGWILPGLILSFLLATGPKAFFVTLAVPLGVGVVTLVFNNILGRKQKPSKQKVKAKKKPPQTRARTSRKSEGNQENQENEAGKKEKIDFESWVAERSEEKATFGGWDELDRREKFDATRVKKSADEIRRPEKSKISSRESSIDGQMLLRLMIAVFPFLGSWLKML